MKNSRGDTIIEVMVAIVVAGLALAVAYQLSNADLRSSTQASQRSQALSYASNQVERLKEAYLQDSTNFVTKYEIASPFCLDVPDQTGNYTPDTNWPADCYANNFYLIKDTFANNTFTITMSWPNINARGNDTLSLYYRFAQ